MFFDDDRIGPPGRGGELRDREYLKHQKVVKRRRLWSDALFWGVLLLVAAFVVSAFVLAPDWYAEHAWRERQSKPVTLDRPLGMPGMRVAKFRVNPELHRLEALIEPIPSAGAPQGPGAWMTAAGLDGLTPVAIKVSANGTLATGADPGGAVTTCNPSCAVIGGLSGLTPVALKVGSDGTVATSGGATGSVTSVATTSPIGGGTITTTGTITCTTCAVTSSGLGQFASTTSAQFAGVISDATGTGSVVLGTSPTLVTPNLGTPSALNLANATGFPAGGAVGTFGISCAPGDITVVCMKDEFIAGQGSLASVGVGDWRWLNSTIGGASTFTFAAGAFPNLGQLQWTTTSTQSQGSSIQLNTCCGQNTGSFFGALGSNVPWDSEFIVKMGSTAATRMRVGWMNAVSTCYSTNVTSISATCDGFWLRYDTNAPAAVNVGNNGITRSSGVVTVTVATHGMSLVGQSVTIAGATGCTTSPNGTFPVVSIPSTTTYTFAQAGTNETCGGNAPATSTPVASTDYWFETKSGAGSPVAFATDTTVAGVTSFVRARIQSTVSGTIIFSLYGSTGTLLAGPTSISTDVATTTMAPTVMFVTDTTATKVIQVDYWSFAASGLSR